MQPNVFNMEGTINSLLEEWVARGWLRSLDHAFVSFLQKQEPESSDPVLLAAALVSHQLGRGHGCLDLQSTLDRPEETLSLPPEAEEKVANTIKPSTLLHKVSLQSWLQCLLHCPLIAPGKGNTPLVIENKKLYLRRYWQYTQQIAQTVLHRLQHETPQPDNLEERLDRHFSFLRNHKEREKKEVHGQSVAAALAVKSLFTVISGGPGTGKTTTVVHLLALLQELAMEDGQQLRIRLAAPTGKAAARLTESIGKTVNTLPKMLRKNIPVEVTTLHRLLGSRPDTRHFSFHAQHPLHVDLLVVDEASMIDLEMMAALLDALPSNARLILLGDKDQLASVEAGSVLGDLCSQGDPSGYMPETAAWIEKNTGYSVHATKKRSMVLGQHIAILQKSHRFGEHSGIGTLAQAVNAGDPSGVEMVWDQGFNDIIRLEISDPENKDFAPLILDGNTDPLVDKKKEGKSVGYRTYLKRISEGRPETWEEDHWFHEILHDFNCFRLLSALRKGNWGVERLNRKVADILFREDLIQATDGWYVGRPVMVTRNDYSLGLMNGDTGILLPVYSKTDAAKNRLKVVFPLPDGSLKKVLPSRLNHVESVYAMTVHKAQGSEFDHTVLAFPDHMSPLLTRELVYTAITRSRNRFTLVGPQVDLMSAVVRHRVYRASGLGEMFEKY